MKMIWFATGIPINPDGPNKPTLLLFDRFLFVNSLPLKPNFEIFNVCANKPVDLNKLVKFLSLPNKHKT